MAQYDGARILEWDIETAKARYEFYTYSLKQHSNFLNPDNVTRPVWIFCAAWKWFGQNTVASTSVLKDPERFEKCYYDDFHVVKTLHDLISEADVLVAHNGDNFDWKLFKTRALFHNLPPVKRPQMVDTLKICRQFKFESASLRYVTRYLDLAEKDEAPDWDEIAQGNADEIRKAEAYCRQDIRALDDLYKRIKPWANNHPNLSVYLNTNHPICTRCQSDDVRKAGFHCTIAGKYQAYSCNTCGAWMKDKKNLKQVELR
jgi:DNA polymerase elongation subunit (family B)